jgi:hypothetical protein
MLRHITTSALVLSLMISSAAWAAVKDKKSAHEAHHPAVAASAASMAASAASGPMNCGMAKDCAKRQDEMKKIRDTKDPAKRKEMHDQHMGKGGMMGQGMAASAASQ